MSVNSIILDLIEESLGFKGKPKRKKKHDLDFLIGTWTPKEYEEFSRQIEVFETIDEGLWTK